MIQKMKYVIVKNDGGLESPIIFSMLIQHTAFHNLNPISAGFIKIDTLDNEIEVRGGIIKDIKVQCFGESSSLGIKSRIEDSEIVREDILKGWCF